MGQPYAAATVLLERDGRKETKFAVLSLFLAAPCISRLSRHVSELTSLVAFRLLAVLSKNVWSWNRLLGSIC
ncbi:hypothetical protein KY284_034305 [Solanum tuberosum]|nr:hypothetical protein KY284_034305 [Solanum tuberosum]